jgi:hypothetical protein
MFRKRLAKYVAASILSLACIGSTLGQAASGDDFKAQIETLRRSLEKYQDYKVAVRDLYLSTVACVHYSGEKIEHHMEYVKGGRRPPTASTMLSIGDHHRLAALFHAVVGQLQ